MEKVIEISEADLYPSIEMWLNGYLKDKYPKYQIETTYKSATHKLENVLRYYNLNVSRTLLLNIKIDILGILTYNKQQELVFVEVKDNLLTLKDLGQLWGYTQLLNPLESFLISSKGLGTIGELYNTLNRRDLFVYGTKKERIMRAAYWQINNNSIDYTSMVPHS
ncbi:hypothetical protein [Ferroplasma sp.]|uniref:hypothetical protein n=1 Tax=Ferroplasma sp. TaxID=2591003 RepID=UPI002631349F|nr:hypothetical protein [Ferroplasma sp.]